MTISTRRVLIYLASWVGYVIVFAVLHVSVVNDMAAVFLAVPLIAGGYLFGRKGGVAGAVLMWPVQAALFLFSGHRLGWDMFAGVEGFTGLLGLAAVGLGAGFAFERLHSLADLNVEKDRLVASVSHEVRNPLTGIVGLSTVLGEDWDRLPPEEAREMVTLIAAEAQSLSMIVNDLLDVSRLRSGTMVLAPEELDLVALVRAIPGVPSVIAVDERVPASADAARVRQIVRNVIVNAERHGAPPIEVAVGTTDDIAWVEVTDRGPGVSPEIIGKLFTPFTSTGGSGSTGLGLSVSRRLAMAMSGKLDYFRRGNLTVFRLELPAVRGSDQRIETSDERLATSD